jgi:hypothetical protein
MTDVVSAMDNGEIGDSDTYIYAFTNKARFSSIRASTIELSQLAIRYFILPKS